MEGQETMMVSLQDVAFVMILVFAFIISCFILKVYPAYVVCCSALPSCYLDVHTSSASPSFAFLSFLCQLFQPSPSSMFSCVFPFFLPHLYCSLCGSSHGEEIQVREINGGKVPHLFIKCNSVITF